MHIKGRSIRVIRVDLKGFGADRCNYHTTYRSHLHPSCEEYIEYIKRKIK